MHPTAKILHTLSMHAVIAESVISHLSVEVFGKLAVYNTVTAVLFLYR